MAQGTLQEELVVRAERAGAPLANAALKVDVEGAELVARSAEFAWTTDAQGLARIAIRPREPHVRVSVEAKAADGATGSFAGRLEVVQGAIRATQQPESLLLESTGAADRVFVGFFDESRRYGGLHAALRQAPDGRLLAEVPWPKTIPRERIWMVTSSQPDLAGPAALGWPVVSPAEPAPTTLDVRELLLLDGAPMARLREERRARRVRLVSAAYAALALVITLFLFVRRVKESDSRIERHLSRVGMQEEASGIAPPRGGRMLLAAACIGLGFLVIALIALLKD